MFYTSFYYLLPSSTLGTSPKKGFQKVQIEKFAQQSVKKAAEFTFYDQKKF